MTDIITGWNFVNGVADWVFVRGNAPDANANPQITFDNDLATAVLISLFTDAQATADDARPDANANGPADRRGWWGGAVGSRIWIYTSRAKATADLPGDVAAAASDALPWRIDDGVATSSDTAAAYVAPGQLVLTVTVHRGNAPSLALQYANFWNAA